MLECFSLHVTEDSAQTGVNSRELYPLTIGKWAGARLHHICSSRISSGIWILLSVHPLSSVRILFTGLLPLLHAYRNRPSISRKEGDCLFFPSVLGARRPFLEVPPTRLKLPRHAVSVFALDSL